jgi:hypothetical protein
MEAMRDVLPGVLVLLTTCPACLEDRGHGQGAGYVVGAAAGVADTVRIAWPYLDPDDSSPRATLRGEVPVEGGGFDVQALLESVEDFEPRPRTCQDLAARQDDQAASSLDELPIAAGWLVATEGVQGEHDLSGQQMTEEVEAAAPDVAVVWAAADVPRDSPTGRRLESSLVAGLQLARLRQCRIPVDCQGVEDLTAKITGQPDPDLCLDPWPDRGLILLQPITFGQ